VLGSHKGTSVWVPTRGLVLGAHKGTGVGVPQKGLVLGGQQGTGLGGPHEGTAVGDPTRRLAVGISYGLVPVAHTKNGIFF
jgi:hypothetical protein